MYYAISGAAGSGKSTLLGDLKTPVEAFAATRGIPVVWQQERARLVYEQVYAKDYESFDALLKADPLGYQVRLAETFASDVATVLANPHTLFIADRTGFDVAVYTMMLGGSGKAAAEMINRVFSTLHAALHAVDHVFLTSPLYEEVEKDGFRPGAYNDPAVRALEVNAFKHIGVLFPHVTPLPRDRAERVSTVLGVIKERLP